MRGKVTEGAIGFDNKILCDREGATLTQLRLQGGRVHDARGSQWQLAALMLIPIDKEPELGPFGV
jgi:hypothetical protein